MKNIVTKLYLILFLSCLSVTLTAQQKGVAINKPSLDNGLVLDVSGLDGPTRLGVRFSPLANAPAAVQEGSMYFDETLKSYRQWNGFAWERMTGSFQRNSSGQAYYSGTVRMDGPVGINRDPDRALDVDGSVRATGPVSGSGLSTGSTGQLYAGFARIGEDNVTSAPGTSFNLQVWGDSWFRSSSTTGNPTFTYVENLALKSGPNWFMIIPDFVPTLSGQRAVGQQGIADPSDERLKESVVPLDGALHKIGRLRGVTYRWNETARNLFTEKVGEGRVHAPEQSEADFAEEIAAEKAAAKTNYSARETGLIAQDIQRVLPEAVVEAEDGFLRVKYGHLAGLFVEAIKEQQAIIDAQAERIRQLESQQLSVLARLEKLEASAATAKPSPAEE